ncbi:MAG: septum formation protein Maf [Deltaproteobacteria bacterium]|nr:septum formation protein Maf [Deltaproteobacteria bacterium]
MSRLVLASASPRRRELLAAAGIDAAVFPSGVDETLPPGIPLEEGLREVALRKARAARQEFPADWILAADTAVVLDRRVLGKPADREEAAAMLRALSGRSHRVITAVALLGPGGGEAARTCITRVWFRPLGEDQIAWYTALPEPYDKAGAYAIQGSAAGFVERIEGSYTNVVGLPLAEALEMLRGTGILPWEPPQALVRSDNEKR